MNKITGTYFILLSLLITIFSTPLAGEMASQAQTEQAVEQEVQQDAGGGASADQAEIRTNPQAAAREATFREASEAFSKADEMDAQLLSPKYYKEARESFERAKLIYDRGGKLADVQRELSESMETLQLATRAAELGQAALKDLLVIRTETLASGLPFANSKDFREAEKKLREAAEKIEKDDLKGARKPSGQSAERYRKAVLQVLEKETVPNAKRKLKDSRQAFSNEGYKQAENALKDLERYVKSQKNADFSVAELTSRVNEEVEKALKHPAPDAESNSR